MWQPVGPKPFNLQLCEACISVFITSIVVILIMINLVQVANVPQISTFHCDLNLQSSPECCIDLQSDKELPKQIYHLLYLTVKGLFTPRQRNLSESGVSSVSALDSSSVIQLPNLEYKWSNQWWCWMWPRKAAFCTQSNHTVVEPAAASSALGFYVPEEESLYSR